VPIVLYGIDFWTGLMDWIKTTMCEKEGNIHPDDLALIKITDDIDEIVDIFNTHYSSSSLKPTF
jgi:hypothetical protein